MREKDSFFCSTCHNLFARLPLNWSLSEMLMLRESGSLRLQPPPPHSPPSWVPRWLDNKRRLMPPSVPTRRGGFYVGQIGADSQSDWFK